MRPAHACVGHTYLRRKHRPPGRNVIPYRQDYFMSSQTSVFRRQELLSDGVRRSHIQEHLIAGRWSAVHPGLYVPADLGSEEAENSRLAAHLIWAGEHSSLSHHSAATLHRLDATKPSCDVWLTVPPTMARRPRPGIHLTRSRTLDESDVELIGAHRVTNRVRTVCDLASVVDLIELERIVESALRGPDPRRPDRWREEVLAELERRVAGDHRQRGMSLLAACLRLRPRGCRPTGSIAETAMVQTLREVGVSDVIRQPTVMVIDDDERLTFFPDLLIPSRRLIIEVDGAHHRDAQRHRSDLRRQNELVAGFHLLRCTATEALNGARSLANKVKAHPVRPQASTWDNFGKRVAGGGLLWRIG